MKSHKEYYISAPLLLQSSSRETVRKNYKNLKETIENRKKLSGEIELLKHKNFMCAK